MKHLARILFLFPIVIALSLFLTTPALAIPPLPSSFYGTVKVNNNNVKAGTLIQALVGEQVYAEGFSKTYQGSSVFALDVPGDDTGTAALEGGRDGDTIQFKIGGVLAEQTALWHTGTNITLNLSASSSRPIDPPPVPPSPVPTQTAFVLIRQPSAVLSTVGEALPASTMPAQPSPIATELAKSSDNSIKDIQPALTRVPIQNDAGNGPGGISAIVVIVIALPVITAMGYSFLAFRKKKISGKAQHNGFIPIDLKGDDK